jgi:hypothetical protein
MHFGFSHRKSIGTFLAGVAEARSCRLQSHRREVRANASSQNVSSMDLSSAKPSRRRRYRRLVPLRLSVSNPAFLSTRRCWDMAERVVSKLSAICPARISRLRMSRRMATRRGSARARNIEAVCREDLAISTCSILGRTALTLVRTNDRVNCS